MIRLRYLSGGRWFYWWPRTLPQPDIQAGSWIGPYFSFGSAYRASVADRRARFPAAA